MIATVVQIKQTSLAKLSPLDLDQLLYKRMLDDVKVTTTGSDSLLQYSECGLGTL